MGFIMQHAEYALPTLPICNGTVNTDRDRRSAAGGGVPTCYPSRYILLQRRGLHLTRIRVRPAGPLVVGARAGWPEGREGPRDGAGASLPPARPPATLAGIPAFRLRHGSGR